MTGSVRLVMSTLVMLATRGVMGANDCTQAATSEGIVTLSDWQLACAQLKEGDSRQDLGKQYVQCVHGHLYTQACPPGLRWDTSINNCNFPERATCVLPDKDIVDTSPEKKTTIRQPATTKKPSLADEDYYDDIDDGITETTRQTRTTTTTPPTTLKTTRKRRTRKTSTTTTTATPSKEPTVHSSTTTRRTTQTTSKRVDTTKKAPVTPTSATSARKTSAIAVESRDCVRVDTSEGTRTLRHGQGACAPLGTDEDESKLGQKFVVCSSRAVHTQQCQPGLRFDAAKGLCNWPEMSTCQFEEDDTPTERSGPIESTDKASTATRNPTQSTRRPKPTGRCNSNNCQLPACFCFGDSPSVVPVDDIPMFIMLTFDDAVTSTLYNDYFRALVVDNNYNLLNPNGCHIKSAFYVSHQNTDYSLVKAIWSAGNEIGSHTIHHELPPGNKDADYPEMVAEIQGLKDEMLKATGSKPLVDSVTGFRAPYLRVAGNVQFNVLKDFGFQYDTSMLNINILQGKPPYWPFTLDYVVGECMNPPCPTKAYPGLWEVPLNGWIGDDKQGCSMVDACVVGTSSWTATQEEWYQFYKRNFEDYFYPVKVPMPIFTHGFLFANYPNSYKALASWFRDLLQTRADVWLVTPSQVIDWMKNPLSNKEMVAQKWGC